MRISHFWTLMNDEFGRANALVMARTHVIGALDGMTADEALEAGISPRDIWQELCTDFDVPESRRHGKDTGPARGAAGAVR